MPALVLLAGLAAWSCSENNPTDPEETSGFEIPAADQMRLDLPSSVAPAGPGQGGGTGPCETIDDSWGLLFACLTRHGLHSIAVTVIDTVVAIMEDVSTKMSRYDVPPNTQVTLIDEGDQIRFVWSAGEGSRNFETDFTPSGAPSAVDRWEWSLREDGGASGSITILSELLGAEADVPDGIALTFQSNADASEKSIHLDIDLPDEPPPDNPNAPTTFRVDAVKSAGTWTVRYGMFLPKSASSFEGFDGVATVLLVSAVSGTDASSEAVMKMVALPAEATDVPPDAETANGVCDYVVAALTAAGLLDSTATCPEPNPFYVMPDGTVQEGGPHPGAFDPDLVEALGRTGFVTDDPTAIRDLTVSL